MIIVLYRRETSVKLDVSRLFNFMIFLVHRRDISVKLFSSESSTL